MVKIKAIIPVAGIGTRLRPHTHTAPKAMLHVAGKPILGHILDKVKGLGITDIILVIGYMGDKIKAYALEEYKDLKFSFAVQEKTLGLGHAISLAEPFVKGEPVLIIYGDTIFIGDISKGLKARRDGCIGVKVIEDPRRFGVVEMKGDKVIRLVEKPADLKPMPAIVGVNFINNSKLLFKSLNELIEKGIKTKDEFQLTDAFQIMVDKGAYLTTFPLDGWYDCGKPETLLETNRFLLENGCDNGKFETAENSVIIPPVYIEKGVVVYNSIIGPFVSVATGAKISNSIIKNSILNKGASVENAFLKGSLIGENAIVHYSLKTLNVGDNSEISYVNE